MRETLLKLIQEKGNIPPLPDILLRLESKIGDPDGDIDDIALLIETEPVLSGRLITLSNSVFFGGGREKVDHLKGAVLRLGLKMILDLAYTMEIPKLFSQKKHFDQKRFWQHSLAVAVISRLLSYRFQGNRGQADLCYLAGLMHDIGIMVFHHVLPEEYGAFLQEMVEAEKCLDEMEQERFGIDHAELGGLFIQKWWPVSVDVVDSVLGHHQEWSLENDQTPDIAQTVHLANAVTNHSLLAHGIGKEVGPLNRNFLVARGMSLESYQDMIKEAEETLETANEILLN